MARALAGTGAQILILERGDFIPQEDQNWNPASVWKDLRYRTTETWLDEARPAVPAVHALLRRRQHQVLGHGDVPAAARRFQGSRSTSTASRRRGRSTTTRWRRTTIAPNGCTTCTASTASIPPKAPRGPYPFPPVPHSPVVGAIVEQLKAAGPASVAAAARPAARTASSATPAIRSRARSTRRATPKCAAVRPATAQRERHAVDQRARRAG